MVVSADAVQFFPGVVIGCFVHCSIINTVCVCMSVSGACICLLGIFYITLQLWKCHFIQSNQIYKHRSDLITASVLLILLEITSSALEENTEPCSFAFI